MKQLAFVLVLLLILSSISLAQNIEDYNDKTYVDMDFNIKGTFELIKKSSSSMTTEVVTNLSFIPKNEINQEILNLNLKSDPPSAITENENNIGFVWYNPTQKDFSFELDSKIRVRNTLVIVDEKIDFPLENIETYYTKPTEFIDINENIRKQAQMLAEGEDDLYVVTFKIGEWVQNNIRYDLSTLTAEVVQKSSWVLKNKEGVCDELTNLFISMLRSLGIPARFVSGMAYTNTKYSWGPHAWAEVYFPKKGWIPFDVTYAQYGWVDPSHIKIRSSTDSNDPAVKYSWKSIDTDFRADKLDINTKLENTGNKIGKQILFDIKPLVNNVGGGSYIPIAIELTNTNNYYLPITLTILKAPQLLEKNTKSILLKPGEKRKVIWIVKIPSNLEENYIYKSKVEVEDTFHNKAESEITYAKELKTINKEEAESLAKEEGTYSTKKISSKLGIECNHKKTIYAYEELNVICNVKNKGNIILKNTEVCLNVNCQNIAELGISESREINFKITNLKNGTHKTEITAKNEDLKVSDIIKTEVLLSPEVDISGIIYNNKPNYGTTNRIELVLSLKAPIKDIEIFLEGSKILSDQELTKPKKLIILSDPSDFIDKDSFEIKLKFKDENNREYTTSKSYPIKVMKIPWYIKILDFLGIL